MKTTSPSKLCHLAFTSVISAYQELVSTSGTIGCMDYSKTSGGKATNSGRSCLVSPSPSDSICDVEIAARRSLDALELQYFNEFYKCTKVVASVDTERAGNEAEVDSFLHEHLISFPIEIRERMSVLDSRVREKLGDRLIVVGLCPWNLYGQPNDVSKPKRGASVRKIVRHSKPVYVGLAA